MGITKEGAEREQTPKQDTAVPFQRAKIQRIGTFLNIIVDLCSCAHVTNYKICDISGTRLHGT